MANKKTELMAEFYEQCQKKGYTNMDDEVQSLKAKVIATDLGLRYKKMDAFYNEASECFRMIQEERKIEAARMLAEQEKIKAEQARLAVDGMFLVLISDGAALLCFFLAEWDFLCYNV